MKLETQLNTYVFISTLCYFVRNNELVCSYHVTPFVDIGIELNQFAEDPPVRRWGLGTIFGVSLLQNVAHVGVYQGLTEVDFDIIWIGAIFD